MTVDFSDLCGFWGEIWPARGGWSEKMHKNVRKKSEIIAKMRANVHGRSRNERKTRRTAVRGLKKNADGGLIEKLGSKIKLVVKTGRG